MAVIGTIANRLVIYEDSNACLIIESKGISFKKFRIITKKIIRKFGLFESEIIIDSSCDFSKIFTLNNYVLIFEWDTFSGFRISSNNQFSNILLSEISVYINDNFFQKIQ